MKKGDIEKLLNLADSVPKVWALGNSSTATPIYKHREFNLRVKKRRAKNKVSRKQRKK